MAATTEARSVVGRSVIFKTKNQPLEDLPPLSWRDANGKRKPSFLGRTRNARARVCLDRPPDKDVMTGGAAGWIEQEDGLLWSNRMMPWLPPHTWQELSLWSRNDAKPFDIIFWSYQVWTSWKTPSHNYLRLYLFTLYSRFTKREYLWKISTFKGKYPHYENMLQCLHPQLGKRWCFS